MTGIDVIYVIANPLVNLISLFEDKLTTCFFHSRVFFFLLMKCVFELDAKIILIYLFEKYLYIVGQ